MHSSLDGSHKLPITNVAFRNWYFRRIVRILLIVILFYILVLKKTSFQGGVAKALRECFETSTLDYFQKSMELLIDFCNKYIVVRRDYIEIQQLLYFTVREFMALTSYIRTYCSEI